MAVTSDSIRERKKKLREEERRNKEKSSQEAASKAANTLWKLRVILAITIADRFEAPLGSAISFYFRVRP